MGRRTCAAGAATGAALLLVSPAGVFEAIVPWLILAACALLAVQPRVAAWIARRLFEQHATPYALAGAMAALAIVAIPQAIAYRDANAAYDLTAVRQDHWDNPLARETAAWIAFSTMSRLSQSARSW